MGEYTLLGVGYQETLNRQSCGVSLTAVTFSAGSHYRNLGSDLSDLKLPQVAGHKKFH